MSLYRCSACGSPNVVIGSEKDGFSYSKGIVGAMVFGAPGVVAGINGKTKQVFRCPDCGLTMDSPMINELKIMIDLGVMSESARNNLTLQGVKIDWSTLTGRYKNIEKGYVDSQLAEKEMQKQISAANDKKIIKQKATATQQEFDDAVDILFKVSVGFCHYQKNEHPYSIENPISKDEFESAVNAVFIIVENLYTYFPPNLYENGAKYRQLPMYFDSLFNEYVTLFYFKHYQMPFLVTGFTIKDLLQTNPFIGAFLRTFRKDRGTELFGWTENLSYIGGNFLPILSIQCQPKNMSKLWGKYKSIIECYDGVKSIFFPRFAVFEDKLAYWEASFGASEAVGTKGNVWGSADFNKIVDFYFTKHADKKKEFKQFIDGLSSSIKHSDDFDAEIKSINDFNKQAESEIPALQRKNQSINCSISENDLEIERLSRKIFFKSKANEQIAELQKANENYINQLNTNTATIKDMEQKVKDNKELRFTLHVAKSTFRQKLSSEPLQQLFSQMNNFIDWTWVE